MKLSREQAKRAEGRAALWTGLALLGAAAALSSIAADERTAALYAACSYLACWALLTGPLRLPALSPALIYLHVLALFHLGLVVPWALTPAWVEAPAWLNQVFLAEPLLLVQLAFVGFFAGAALMATAGRMSRRRRIFLHSRGLFQIGLAVIAVGLTSLAWGVRSVGWERLLEASYTETYRLVQDYDPRFFITSLQVTPMGFYLCLAAAPRRWVAPTTAAAAAWTLTIFALGYRGYALTPALTAVVLLHKRGFRLPRAALGAGCALLLIAIPAGRALRAERLADRVSGGWDLNGGPVAALAEMGGSLRPLAHTVELLGDEPYRWGRTYVLALGDLVPNVSSEWSGGAYIPLEDLPPSHWVTRLAAPWKYAHHGGLGFSAIAEAYMNFGPAGVCGVFALLGALLVWSDGTTAAVPTRLALWAMLYGPLIWNVRNSAAVFVRPAVWGVVLVLAARVAADSISAAQRRGFACAAVAERRGRGVPPGAGVQVGG